MNSSVQGRGAAKPFRCKRKPPKLKAWEGPFADPTRRLPQHPVVAAERREEKQRYRLRKKIREREAAQLAAERDGAAGGLPCRVDGGDGRLGPHFRTHAAQQSAPLQHVSTGVNRDSQGAPKERV